MNAVAIESLFRIDGHRALVTGASGGLGRHFAQTLARAGAEVVVAARRKDALAQTVALIEQAGGRALAVCMDVTSAASVHAAFDEAHAQGGVADIVVNNAGIAVQRPALEQDEADWHQVIDTNLKGSWLVATEAARRLVAERRPGSIINIASILGQRVAGGVAPYAISKAGILQATRSLALECARHHIRVNAILPGYVETELNRDFLRSDAGNRLRERIPYREFAQPADLDGPLLLLASDAGRWMTGTGLAVDGGHLVSSL